MIAYTITHSQFLELSNNPLKKEKKSIPSNLTGKRHFSRNVENTHSATDSLHQKLLCKMRLKCDDIRLNVTLIFSPLNYCPNI